MATHTAGDNLRIGIVTVSDRAYRGEYEDLGGPAVRSELEAMLFTSFEPLMKTVPDERFEIESALCALADDEACSLIVTTGGTGPAPRDVTPDATLAVIEKALPGFGEVMRAESLRQVPTAILSRQCAGIRGASLIINLPGSPKAIGQCLRAVMPAVADCIDLIGGPNIETNPEVVKTFRPHLHHSAKDSKGVS